MLHFSMGVTITDSRSVTGCGLHWCTDGCTGRCKALLGPYWRGRRTGPLRRKVAQLVQKEGKKLEKKKKNHPRYQVSASLLLIYF